MKCDCGKQMRVVDEQAGKRVKCPGCGEILAVPKPEAEQAAETKTEAAAPAVVTFECDQCHKPMQAKVEHAGKLAKCPGCEAKVRIPAKQDEEEIEEVEAVAEKPRKKARATEDDVEEVGVSAVKPSKKARAVVEDVEEVEEADRPKKRKARVVDDDEDDRPRKKKRKGTRTRKTIGRARKRRRQRRPAA